MAFIFYLTIGLPLAIENGLLESFSYKRKYQTTISGLYYPVSSLCWCMVYLSTCTALPSTNVYKCTFCMTYLCTFSHQWLTYTYVAYSYIYTASLSSLCLYGLPLYMHHSPLHLTPDLSIQKCTEVCSTLKGCKRYRQVVKVKPEIVGPGRHWI